jgi:hypothetical protein
MASACTAGNHSKGMESEQAVGVISREMTELIEEYFYA